MMNGFGWGGWLLGGLLMVGVWVLIFWAVVSLARRPEAAPGARCPEDILGERFARGEIDSDEYTRRRDALRTG